MYGENTKTIAIPIYRVLPYPMICACMCMYKYYVYVCNVYMHFRVWREWLIENDTFTGMHFTMGQECSVGDREVKVQCTCIKYVYMYMDVVHVVTCTWRKQLYGPRKVNICLSYMYNVLW